MSYTSYKAHLKNRKTFWKIVILRKNLQDFIVIFTYLKLLDLKIYHKHRRVNSQK